MKLPMSIATHLVSRRIPLSRSYFNLGERERVMWNYFYRWLVPQPQRWFFEGNRSLWGQLWLADRKVLYETVRRIEPQNVFEVGTWRGGGSTYFIACALRDNGRGILYTTEIDSKIQEQAVESYQRFAPHLIRYIQFYQGSSTDVYPLVLQKFGTDMVFLDGIGAEQTLAEFRLFEPYFRKGGVLISHDWNDEKTSLLRPYIESLSDWKLLHVIHPPESVGIAVYQFEGR